MPKIFFFIAFMPLYILLLLKPLYAYPIACGLGKADIGTKIKMRTQLDKNAPITPFLFLKGYVLEPTFPVENRFWLAVIKKGIVIGYLNPKDIKFYCYSCTLSAKYFGTKIKMRTRFDRDAPQTTFVLTRKHVLRPRYFNGSANSFYWLAVFQGGVIIGYLDRKNLQVSCGNF